MVKIIADTTCGLPLGLMTQLGIFVLPQIIIFGEESYRDDIEIDTPTFLSKLRAASILPKTAAPPPALYEPIYQQIAAAGDTGIVITPSADVSGTFRSASVALENFPGADIHILDSRTVAGGLGSLVLTAHTWAQNGKSASEILAGIKQLAQREVVYFVVDTLEYLHKGGRIGGAKALLGSILQVKPILSLKDGRIEPVESQRTKKHALARLRELVIAKYPDDVDAMLTISHIEADDVAAELTAFFKDKLHISSIPTYQVPPAIAVHAGPKVISVSFFTK